MNEIKTPPVGEVLIPRSDPGTTVTKKRRSVEERDIYLKCLTMAEGNSTWADALFEKVIFE